MPQADKISEFTTRARDELAKLANDNAPPEAAEAIRKLMQAVLHPAGQATDSYGGDRPLDDRELWAIGMMIECQADEFGVLSRLVILAVEIAFEVDDLTVLRAAQFDAVMSYLAHLPGHRP